MSDFEVGNRVTIDLDYPGGWRAMDLKSLRGRLGTVRQVDATGVLVQFDKRFRQGQQTLVNFTNPDCLMLLPEGE